MQVLYTFHGSYPFGENKESQNTFMQLIKQNLSEEEISLFRQMTKIYKGIKCPHFIKLIKMLKEDNKLYFIYQYEAVPLLSYLEQLGKYMQGSFTKEKYKSFLIQFKSNIDSITQHLIKNQIKADVLISNMAYLPKKDQQDGFLLKVFIDMDAQYLSLIDHNYKPKDSKKKDRLGSNQEFLQQFYEAERKRLMMNFEQLLEKTFGKIQNAEEKQLPNFIIQGNKLIFQKDEKCDKSGEYKVQAKKSNEKSQKKKNHTRAPIIDFDQSFEPEFKPEEFLQEETYIYAQNDYLQSLEEELNKMAFYKKGSFQTKKSQVEVKPEKVSSQSPPEQRRTSQLEQPQNKEVKPIDLTISQGSTQSTPNNMSHNRSKYNASSNNDSYDEKKKEQNKKNKYNMKIITSHQIQIEGGEEPNVEQIGKQIIQGVRNGKIRVNQNDNNNQKLTVTTNNQNHQSLRIDSINPDLYKSDHTEKNRQKEQTYDKQKMTNSENLKKPQWSAQKQPGIITKEIPISKIKTVKQIIENIGIKAQKNQIQPQNSKKEYEESEPPEKSLHASFQSVKTPIHKVQKNQYVDVKQKMEKLKKKVHIEKSQKNDKTKEKENAQEKVEKSEKAEKYMNRIKEIKQKAEQILKEYSKKRHETLF